MPSVAPPSHYQIIFEVFYEFKPLSPNILHFITLIGLFRYMYGSALSLNVLPDFILCKVPLSITVIHCYFRKEFLLLV